MADQHRMPTHHPRIIGTRHMVSSANYLAAETGFSILEAGGSRSAMDSFKAFRGREPQIDALLRHQGMAETQAAA